VLKDENLFGIETATIMKMAGVAGLEPAANPTKMRLKPLRPHKEPHR
jgi:hypothetical protein